MRITLDLCGGMVCMFMIIVAADRSDIVAAVIFAKTRELMAMPENARTVLA